MENDNEKQLLVQLSCLLVLAALFALRGRKRKIGYWWGFVACFFLSPIIGSIIISYSDKIQEDIKYTEIK
jgi:F0F1-type ATP synthase assembly protein I